MNTKLVHRLAAMMAALFLWPAFVVPAPAQSGPDRPEDLTVDSSAEENTLYRIAPSRLVEGYLALRDRLDAEEKELPPLVGNTGTPDACFNDKILEPKIHANRAKSVSGGGIGPRTKGERGEVTVENLAVSMAPERAPARETDATTDSPDKRGAEVVLGTSPAQSIRQRDSQALPFDASSNDHSGVSASLSVAPYSSFYVSVLRALPNQDSLAAKFKMLGLESGELSGDVLAPDSAGDGFSLQNSSTYPRIQRMDIVSTPTGDHAYGYGEAIRVHLTFDGPVSVTGRPFLRLQFDEHVQQKAVYRSGSGSTVLEFVYWVFNGDRDQDGVSIPAGTIDINRGAITGTAIGEQAALGYPALPDDARHRVDGGTPPVVSLVKLVPNPSREGNGLNALVKMTPSIPPNFTTEVTGGVHIFDSAVDDVSLNAWRFYPGQTTTTSTTYVIFDDGRITRDRTIRFEVNRSFYSYTVGDPGALTVSVTDDNNATLCRLSTSAGMLAPAFDSVTTAYSVMVDNAVGDITVTAEPCHHEAGITINGQIGASQSVPLAVGMNTVAVTVTTPGGAQLTYTLSVTRAMAGNPGSD